MTPTTVVYAPHPDDETLCLSGYVTTVAAQGHRLVLGAVEDGGGPPPCGLRGGPRRTSRTSG